MRPDPRPLAWKGLERLGVGAMVGHRLADLGWVSVLALHHVGWERSHPLWSMTPDDLDELLTHCNHVGTIVSVERAHMVEASNGPRFVITIDDGYASFVEHILPILRAHGDPPVNLNVVTESIRTGQAPWMVLLYDAIDGLNPVQVEALADEFGGRAVAKRRWPARLSLSVALREMKRSDRVEALGTIAARFGRRTESASLRMLSLEEVRGLPDSVAVGAHSMHHDNMRLAAPEDFVADIRGCREMFEELGRPFDIYAFPNGDYRDTQLSILRAEGVRHPLAVGDVWHRPGSMPITRFTMHGSTTAEVRLRAVGLPKVPSAARRLI